MRSFIVRNLRPDEYSYYTIFANGKNEIKRERERNNNCTKLPHEWCGAQNNEYTHTNKKEMVRVHIDLNRSVKLKSLSH